MKLKHVLRLIPIASFGVVLGHIFVYRHLFAGSSHSHDVLAETGHTYFGTATIAATLIAVVSLVLYAWVAYRGRLEKSVEKSPGFWPSFVVLSVTQIVLFVCMELIERASTHGSADAAGFFASNIFNFGIVFQIAAAAFVALLVTGAVQAGAFVAGFFESTCAPTFLAYPAATQNQARVYSRAICIRGPPHSRISSHPMVCSVGSTWGTNFFRKRK